MYLSAHSSAHSQQPSNQTHANTTHYLPQFSGYSLQQPADLHDK